MLNADIKEFEFTSDFDGLVISAVAAVPSGEPSGVVQIVHGINEHKELYFPFMDYLAGEGFITVIHDNRGHGKSICTEDDIGFMFRNGGEGFVKDITQLSGFIKETFPGLPVFMAAQGIGSLGARCFVKENDDRINGLIVLGCPCSSMFSSIVRSIESALSKEQASRTRSESVYETAAAYLGKKFPEDVPNAWLSSDMSVVEEINNDALCNFKYTLNGCQAFLWLLRETYSRSGWQLKNPSMPVRFISGRDDPMMISEKKLMKAVHLMEKAGYEATSHRLFDGMRHAVLLEKNCINVYKDIAKTLFSWIDRFNDEREKG